MEHFKIKPNVILVGKPNVGKSTLFNRLSNMKISIAHQTNGTTRDCIMRDVEILGHTISFADSGGLENHDDNNPFQSLVSQRVDNFLAEKASLILFLVSAKDGITNQDEAIAQMLRKLRKPVILLINKVDNENNISLVGDCFRFGFKKELMISAAQNRGIAELHEEIIKALGLVAVSHVEAEPSLHLIKDEQTYEADSVAIAVVGKPNSGKSTFVNTILNEDRVMTSEIPGTTLDAIDTHLQYAGKKITLIDTAGIRRKRSIDEEIEKMAVSRTLCAVDRADVAIMMLSAPEGVTEQDKKVAGLIFEKKKACIIAVNKWDEKIADEKEKAKFIEDIKFHLPFFSFAPITFLSAKYGTKVFNVIEHALRLAPRFNKTINTSKLNRSIERAQEAHPAPVEMGRRIKLFFGTQVSTAPPTFSITCNMPERLHFSYQRYLANYLRKDLQLDEIPIRLLFRKKSSSEENVA